MLLGLGGRARATIPVHHLPFPNPKVLLSYLPRHPLLIMHQRIEKGEGEGEEEKRREEKRREGKLGYIIVDPLQKPVGVSFLSPFSPS